MRNVSDEMCEENQNTLLCSVAFFPPENRTVYEIKWKILYNEAGYR